MYGELLANRTNLKGGTRHGDIETSGGHAGDEKESRDRQGGEISSGTVRWQATRAQDGMTLAVESEHGQAKAVHAAHEPSFIREEPVRPRLRAEVGVDRGG